MAIVVKSPAGATLATISPVVPAPQVTISTSLGDMVIELYPANAPLTVNNFLKYVSSNFYTNLIFHRTVPGFVIQGGGLDAALKESATNPAIKLEMPNGLSNLRGTIAMARTEVLDSATSQFFINTVDNTRLDTAGGGYAVFGKVVTGLRSVDAIVAVPTKSVGDYDNVPVTPVTILSATQTR
ncbi:peptidylprolyl isomerase [Oxalobacteraceae bacterium]|nr:peptidylprolyl isomerase [Oxalobacteraceae bacterium]